MLSRIFLTVIWIIAFGHSNAQSLNAGLGYGAGYFYVFEVLQGETPFQYNPPWVTNTNLSFSPSNSYFDLGLQVQYASLQAKRAVFEQAFTGSVNTLNIGLLLEHVQDSQAVNLGYAFGMGISNESFEINFTGPTRSTFTSVNLQGIVEFPLAKRAAIRLRPQLLWSDPINTFLPNRWVSAGEDLNALLTLEFNYAFDKGL